MYTQYVLQCLQFLFLYAYVHIMCTSELLSSQVFSQFSTLLLSSINFQFGEDSVTDSQLKSSILFQLFLFLSNPEVYENVYIHDTQLTD